MARKTIEAPVVVPPPEGPLGIPASSTQVALQTDVFKELINKLSWTLGSTFRRPYSNRRMKVRQLAVRIATRIIAQEGWPRQIGKE